MSNAIQLDLFQGKVLTTEQEQEELLDWIKIKLKELLKLKKE